MQYTYEQGKNNKEKPQNNISIEYYICVFTIALYVYFLLAPFTIFDVLCFPLSFSQCSLGFLVSFFLFFLFFNTVTWYIDHCRPWAAQWKIWIDQHCFVISLHKCGAYVIDKHRCAGPFLWTALFAQMHQILRNSNEIIPD